jgi:hypothetical protein
LNGLAQSPDADKETKKLISKKLEQGEKSFRTKAAGDTEINFFVKFDGCKVSVTRVLAFTSGILSATAYRDGGINTSDRAVRRSRNNYTFNLSDIDFYNIKFSATENKGEIVLPVLGEAKLIKAVTDNDGITRREFQSKHIFRVDKADGEKTARQLAGLARNCRENQASF